MGSITGENFRKSELINGLWSAYQQCFPNDLTREGFDSLLSSAGVMVLVFPDYSILSGKKAGFEAFLIYRIAADEAEIISIGTVPQLRRIGLANKLLEKMQSILPYETAVRTIFLEVSVNNHEAVNLYKRAGFVQVATRRNYYRLMGGETVDALVMRKNL